jgi:hypothetical protein
MGIVLLDHSVIRSKACLTKVQLHVSREDAEKRVLAAEIGNIFQISVALVEFGPRICGEST